MLPRAVLLVAVAAASVGLADDGTTPLADAIRAINQQAAKLPESRALEPLTEEQVVKAIRDLARQKDKLPDADCRELQRIAETRRVPKSAILRQFVRYNDQGGVQHGWWVRLMLLREGEPLLVVPVREHLLFRRPYTQKERLFQEEVRRSGIPTMGRLVAYFEEDPKSAVVQRFSPQRAQRLAEAVKKAINEGKADDLLTAYHWEGVDQETRAEVRAEAERLVKRRLASVSVSPRRFGGRLRHGQGFRTWDPNLPVLGYIALEFTDNDGPRSVCLEFGETRDGARLVNYIVSRDDGPLLIGKPPSGPIRVHGLPMVSLGDGWFELYFQIEAPDELPALQNANLELWKVHPTPPSEPPRAEKVQPGT